MKQPLPQKIGTSMLDSFRACPWQFYLNYVLARNPHAKSLDLTAGGAFSAGVEAFRTAFYLDDLPLSACMERAALAATLSWPSSQPIFPEDPSTKKSFEAKTLDRILLAIRAYFSTYSPYSDLLQPKPQTSEGVSGFEYSFAIPLDPEDGFPLHPSGEPFLFASRLDTLGTYDRIPCFADEKTTKAIGPKWAGQWSLRSQFIGYCWALNLMGMNIDHCLIRGVAIQKTQLRFIEHFQSFPRHLQQRWEKELKRSLRDMIRMWEEGDWEVRIGPACSAYSGCAFKTLCLAPEGTQRSIFEQFPANEWEPGGATPKIPLLDNYRLWQIHEYNKEI
jgi:hypothetical protein